MVFTPKSMLRLKDAVSPVAHFTSGRFEPVLPDVTVDPAGVRRVLLVSGEELVELILRLARDNPSWGYTRIHGAG